MILFSHAMTLYYTYIYCDLKNNVQYGKQYNSSETRESEGLVNIRYKAHPLVIPVNQTVPKR